MLGRAGQGRTLRSDQNIFYAVRFLIPNVFTYTGAMKAYINCPNGGKKTLEIVEEMNNQYRGRNRKARPDIQALEVAFGPCAETERILDGIDDSKKERGFAQYYHIGVQERGTRP
jgi:hypothetical protein